MRKFSILLVGGTWAAEPDENGEYGRSSGIVAFVYAALKSEHRVTMFNGGNYNELQNIMTFADAYDIVFWWANVPDNTLPKIRDVKDVAPHTMLVSSKRNDGDKYSFMELTQHALARKANLTFEFKQVDIEVRPGRMAKTYHIMVFDPLGCKWYDGIDVCQATQAAMQRLTYLRSITRQKTTQSTTSKELVLAWYFDQFKQPEIQSDRQVETPDESKFINLVREYAERFHEIMNPGCDIKRFLGNASLRPKQPPQVGRCSKGMPSFKAGDYVFVSQRNVDKQFLTLDHFVPCYMEHDKLYYCGNNKPSVDAPIQLRLYASLPNIRYIIHSHCYIDGAVFTEKSIPCGAIEEVDEVIKTILNTYGSYYLDAYAINLKGHGSLLMASDITGLKDIEYIGRPFPEDMTMDIDMCVTDKQEQDTSICDTKSDDDLPEWLIPVTWQMSGNIAVRAKTLADAMKLAIASETPLPSGEYVDDSCELSCDDKDYIRTYYNNGQNDIET